MNENASLRKEIGFKEALSIAIGQWRPHKIPCKRQTVTE